MPIKVLRHLVLPLFICLTVGFIAVGLINCPVHAAEGEFFLQVSPSPLVATLKPGQQTTLDLKIRNAGTQTEQLTINPRSFKIDNVSGEVEFNDTTPPEVAGWLQFGAKSFAIAPGQTFDQKIIINVPKDAGFSYSFAFLIQRQDVAAQPQLSAGQNLKGQVAIFALMNIDRPGATRELKIDDFTSESGMYENLPATLHLRLKNTGNTIVQPAGDVFIQRNLNDTTPITTIPANGKGGYILPGTIRTLEVKWNEANNQSWTNFRIGYYVAKAVVIYNDGVRDVPVMAEVGFWIIPWKILGGITIILIVLGFGIWTIISKVWKLSGRSRKPKSMRLGGKKR